MKLSSLMNYVEQLWQSGKRVEQAEDMLNALYSDRRLFEYDAEQPGGADVMSNYRKKIEQQEKIIEENTIEKIFANRHLSKEEINVLCDFRELLTEIDNPCACLSNDNEELANPAYEAVLFTKHLGSVPVSRDINLTREIAKGICDAAKYFCKEYVAYDDDNDVVYKIYEIEDVMDKLLSVSSNLSREATGNIRAEQPVFGF